MANIVPANIPLPQTPHRDNPGTLSTAKPHLSQAGRFKSNFAAINEVVDAMDIDKTPPRKKQISFSIPRTPKRRKSKAAANSSSDVINRRRSGSSEEDSDRASTIIPRVGMSVRRRAALRASTIANLMHMPKLALKAATAANRGDPRPSHRKAQKATLRKRAQAAAHNAKDALQLRTEIFIHGRRKISDLEKDKYGNNWPRVTKKERAGKNWDPAEVEYYGPAMTGPPTPGRLAFEFGGTPER